MDDLVKKIIEAAEASGAKVQVLGVNTEKNEKSNTSDDMDGLDIITFGVKLSLENDDFNTRSIASVDKFGITFLNETLNISEDEVKQIFEPALSEFENCFFKFNKVLKDALKKALFEEGEINNDSKN